MDALTVVCVFLSLSLSLLRSRVCMNKHLLLVYKMRDCVHKDKVMQNLFVRCSSRSGVVFLHDDCFSDVFCSSPHLPRTKNPKILLESTIHPSKKTQNVFLESQENVHSIYTLLKQNRKNSKKKEKKRKTISIFYKNVMVSCSQINFSPF